MVRFARKVGLIAFRELQAEARTKEAFVAMLVFALLVAVVFSFALNPGREAREEIFPGLLWVTFFFAGLLGLGRSFAGDRGFEPLGGLLLAPVDRAAIFFGKAAANLVLVGIVELAALPVFSAFFDIRLPLSDGRLWASLVLGTLGFILGGTFMAALAANARAAELLLPLLLFPVLVPVVIAAVQTTGGVLARALTEELAFGYRILVVYTVVFLAAPWLLFEYLLES